MKKFFCIMLILVTVLSFAACSKEPELNEVEIVNGTTSQSGGSNEPQSTAPYMNKTMVFSIPISFISEKDRSDLDKYCNDHGYTEISLNEKKGIAKIEMPKFSHQLLMTRLGLDVIKAIYDILEDGIYPYFKSIDSYDEKNFRKIDISVNGDEYNADPSSEMLPYSLAQSCYTYQAYSTSIYYRCKVTVRDAESGTVISDKTYTF